MYKTRDPFDTAPDQQVYGDAQVPMVGLAMDSGVQWWRDAFHIFKLNPFRWILAILIALLLGFVIGRVLPDIIGSLVLHIMQTVMIGGLCLACQQVEDGGPFRIGMLFAGFKKPYFWRLTAMALVLGLGFFVFFLIVGLTLSAIGLAANFTEMPHISLSMATLPVIVAILLIVTVSLTLMSMFYWFAPALIVLHGVGPVDALRLSFVACLKNIAPMLSFSIIGLLLMICGLFTAGIGFLVIVPVAIATIYTSTRSVFEPGGPLAAPVHA